jgi:hypothetical protein
MKKIIKLLLFQIVLLSAISCAKNSFYQSAYQSNEFKLTELNKDWSGGTYASSDQGMVYGLTNDDKYLYVKLKVVGERNQRKIIMNGLILWLDVEGKSKKKRGYAFPLVNEKVRAENNLLNMSDNDPELRSQLQSLQIEIGKVNKRFSEGDEAINVISDDGEVIETIESHRNKEGVNMMIYMDQYHILYYEARIPLAKIFGDNMISPISEIPAFSYGFEIGELELGVQNQMYVRPSYMMRNSQMERSSMNSRRRNAGQQQIYGVKRIKQRPIEVWVKQVKLSAK